MSVLFWVFAAQSGVDYYSIDSVQGTYASLEVRGCTVVTHWLRASIETDNSSRFAPGCIFDGMHTSIAAFDCQDIRVALL